MALFDDIKAQLDRQPKAAPVPSYQKMAEKLLKAKAGIIDSKPSSTPAASRRGEQAAVAAASEGALGSRVQGLLASQGLEAQAAQQRAEAGQAQAELSAQRQSSYADLSSGLQKSALQRQAQEEEASSRLLAQKNIQQSQSSAAFQRAADKLASDRKVSEDDIFRTFRQGSQELGQRRDAAALEELAQTLALRDDAYATEIKRVGDLNGLADEGAFRREYARIQNNNNEQLTQMYNDWFIEFNKDKNAFAEKLANIDMDSAMSAMKTIAQAEGEGQMIRGGVKVGQAVYEGRKQSERDAQAEKDRQDRKATLGY